MGRSRGGLTSKIHAVVDTNGLPACLCPERCPHCGWSALGCAHFDPNDARRQVWTGKWPGEQDCERLRFFVNDDPDFPDLNRLFTDCIWDADTQRWERKQ